MAANITESDISVVGCRPYFVQPTKTQSGSEAYWAVDPVCPKLNALKRELEMLYTPDAAGKIPPHLTLLVVKRIQQLDSMFGNCKTTISLS
jgi:hypothetical protein